MKKLGTPGIYRVYRRYLGQDEQIHLRLMGRFALVAGNIHVMEDHDGIVSRMFQPGEFSPQDLSRMEQMEHSPYWHVVLEENVENGHHPEYMATVQHPAPEPWAVQGDEQPQEQK